MRIFFAVCFSDVVKKQIQHAIDAVSIQSPPWRWVPVENIHITLKFLGEVPDETVEPLVRSVAAASDGFPSFHIRLGAMDGFPKLIAPRVLFYHVAEGGEPLKRLAHVVEEALHADHGIPREKRPFRPHVTVARVKRPVSPDIAAKLRAAPAPEDAGDRVARIVLMRSELHPKGARYHRVKEIALQKPK